MSIANVWPRKQSIAVLGVIIAPACARATDDPIEGLETPPIGGFGGELAMAGMGGTDPMLGGGGGVAAGTGGGSSGDAGTGGVAAGEGGTGGIATGGAGMGGTAGTSAGTGGTSSGMAGAAGTMGGAGSSNSGGGAGMGGRAGTSSMGGKGGTSAAGASGAGGAAGAGGRAGKGGAGGAGGGATTMNGCAKLSVPMNDANDKAHFTLSLNNTANLGAAGTTISLHVYVQAGTGGRIFAYAQDSSFNFLGPANRPLLANQNGWVTLTWNVASEPTVSPAITKSDVKRIGIEIQAAPSTTWSNPTVVYVDSITVNTPSLSFPFSTSGTVSTATNQSSDVSGQVLWLNANSSDTTASGTALSWVATCP